MSELPSVHYHRESLTDDEASREIDSIIRKFNLGESPTEFLEIRKRQVLEHSNRDELIRSLRSLTDLFGENDDPLNRARMDNIFKELNLLHSPLVFNLPSYSDEDFKGKEIEVWSVDELYSEYLLLCNLKGWEDYYTFDDKFDGFLNFQVIDMLNDLCVNKMIMSYLIYSDLMEESKLLEKYDSSESVIEVIRWSDKDWGTGDYVHQEDL